MQQLIRTIRQSFLFWDNTIKFAINWLPYEPIWLLNDHNAILSQSPQSFSINEFMQDGFLWGVPKKRPTVERRVKKRFGLANYPQCSPILRPRNDIVVCERCGDHHEAYTICRTCYLEVKDETDKLKKEMKEKIDPLEPKELEIRFRYESDDKSQSNASDNKKFRIIEIARTRPKWFAENILAKSSQSSTGLRAMIMKPEDAKIIKE